MSRGIGRSFSIEHRIVSPYVSDPNDLRYTAWKKGNAYNYGIGEPHYPVPAIQYRTMLDWSDIKVNTIIGLMLGNFTHHRLEKYWHKEK